MYLPGYGLVALAPSLPFAVAGAFFAATGQSSAVVLLNSAAHEEVPDGVLGRVLGVSSLAHRRAHATGLLLVAPLYAFVDARAVFAAALAVPVVGAVGLRAQERPRVQRTTRRGEDEGRSGVRARAAREPDRRAGEAGRRGRRAGHP